MREESQQSTDKTNDQQTAPKSDIVDFNNIAQKDKKQREIEILMKQQEQLKNLEKLGMLQQQQKAMTEKAKDEIPPVRNENNETVAAMIQEKMPDERPTKGKTRNILSKYIIDDI